MVSILIRWQPLKEVGSSCKVFLSRHLIIKTQKVSVFEFPPEVYPAFGLKPSEGLFTQAMNYLSKMIETTITTHPEEDTRLILNILTGQDLKRTAEIVAREVEIFRSPEDAYKTLKEFSDSLKEEFFNRMKKGMGKSLFQILNEVGYSVQDKRIMETFLRANPDTIIIPSVSFNPSPSP